MKLPECLAWQQEHEHSPQLGIQQHVQDALGLSIIVAELVHCPKAGDEQHHERKSNNSDARPGSLEAYWSLLMAKTKITDIP